MATRPRKGRTIEAEDVFQTEQELQLQQQEALMRQRQALQLPAPGLEDHEMFDADDFDAVTSLNTVLAELGISTESTKGFITVFKEKTVNATKQEEYLGKFSVTEFANGNLLDHLQNNFGGGKYHIRVYAPGGGSVILRANKFIDIAANASAVPGAPIAMQQTPAASLDLTPLVSMMQQGFEKMFTAMQSMQPHQKSTVEILQELQIMKEVFAPANLASAAPSYNPVEMMKLGMEMATKGGGGGDESNNAWVTKMIEVFGKPIVDGMVAAKANQATPTPQAQRTLPSPAPAAQAAQPSQPTEPEQPMNLLIKGYIKMIESAAASNADVGEYADNILGFLPASQVLEFEGILRAPDWQTKLSSYSPAVNAYPVWFGALRETLLAYIDEDRAAASGVALTGDAGDASVAAHETANTLKTSDSGDAGGTA